MNVTPSYFQRKIEEKKNQKKTIAVWFPSYLLYSATWNLSDNPDVCRCHTGWCGCVTALQCWCPKHWICHHWYCLEIYHSQRADEKHLLVKNQDFFWSSYNKDPSQIKKDCLPSESSELLVFVWFFLTDFRHHQGIYSNLKISSLVTMTCQCQLLSWQSNLGQKMAKGYAIVPVICTDNNNRWCSIWLYELQ